MLVPKSFEVLSKNFCMLPGVGEKTADRFVYALENKDGEEIDSLCEALLNFKKTIRRCELCNCLSDDSVCPICSDTTKNREMLCIVEDSKVAFSIDKTNKYNGLYFVLSGLISPMDGVDIEDLNINMLLKRVQKDIKEVIIALNPSIEGEVTSLYLQKKLEKYDLKVSRLSYGIPIGTDIEYLDPIMITKALEDRKTIS